MAARNEQVLDLVRQELSNQPELGSKALYERARQEYPSLEDEGLKKFHALYVLTAKRERAAAAREAGEAPPRPPQKPRRSRKSGGAASDDTPVRPRSSTRRVEQSAGVEGTAAAQGGGPGSDRDHVRGVLLQFARDFAAAESRSEIVDVLGKVDEYVERIVRKGGRAAPAA